MQTCYCDYSNFHLDIPIAFNHHSPLSSSSSSQSSSSCLSPAFCFLQPCFPKPNIQVLLLPPFPGSQDPIFLTLPCAMPHHIPYKAKKLAASLASTWILCLWKSPAWEIWSFSLHSQMTLLCLPWELGESSPSLKGFTFSLHLFL